MHTDFIGQPLDVGDKIVVAFRRGSDVELRTGVILEFVRKNQRSTDIDGMSIEWHLSSFNRFSSMPDKSTIELQHKRFFKIAHLDTTT